MKGKAIIGAVITAAVFATSANAAWKPGTAYTVQESDANSFLERVFDSAYCNGIARFGKVGEFPYEEYRVFDCSVKRNEMYCTDWRFKALKGNRPGYYKMRSVRTGKCY